MNFLRRRKRQGQSMVEMAIVVPLFLLVIVGGIIDFGFAFYNLLTLQEHADNVAQRSADNNVTNAGAIAASATSSLPASLEASRFQVTVVNKINFTSTIAESGWRVTLSYRSRIYTPFYQTMLGLAGSPDIPLSANAFYKIPLNLVNR